MIKKRVISYLFGFISLCMATAAFGVDLIGAYQDAYENDPTLQEQRYQFLSTGEGVPIARSFLLPQASYFLFDQTNRSTVSSSTDFSNAGTYDFNSNGWNLQVTQSVFDFSLWAGLGLASESAKAAEATYSAAIQDLMIRTAASYFNVLLSEDILRFTLAEKQAVWQQLDQTEQQYRVGLISITGVYQARAQYDDILAQEITARNNIINAKEDLRAITGHIYDKYDGLKKEIPLITPDPKNSEAWVDIAEEQNLSLIASRYTYEAARQNINVQRAGHLPTIDAVASMENANAGDNGFGNTQTQTMSAGLQLNVPIFSGGLVYASTQQAEYDANAARSSMEFTRRLVNTQTRQSYNDVNANVSKIKADRQAIISNESSLRSTEAAYRVGTNTILDVLQAQQFLFEAQQIYASDQYDYLNSILSLKQAAGTLNVTDLDEINSWMVNTTRKSSVNYAPALPAQPEPSTNPNQPFPHPTQTISTSETA